MREHSERLRQLMSMTLDAFRNKSHHKGNRRVNDTQGEKETTSIVVKWLTSRGPI